MKMGEKTFKLINYEQEMTKQNMFDVFVKKTNKTLDINFKEILYLEKVRRRRRRKNCLVRKVILRSWKHSEANQEVNPFGMEKAPTFNALNSST